MIYIGNFSLSSKMTFPYKVTASECKNSPHKLISEGHEICPECWEEAMRHKTYLSRKNKSAIEVHDISKEDVETVKALCKEAQPKVLKDNKDQPVGSKRKRGCPKCLMPEALCDCK